MGRTRRRTLVALSGLSILTAVAACGGGADATTAGGDTVTTPDASSESSASTADSGSGAAASDGTYTDGTYTAKGSYESPAGNETIEVSLTVADDVVTDVTVTPMADDATAVKFETQFASGIADEVVGKSLDGLSVDKVSGSSLTGTGFNAALDQIRTDAVA